LALYYKTKILQGPQDLCDLSRGVISQRVREKKWYELENFGFLMDIPEKGVMYFIRQLMAAHFFKMDWTKGGLLLLTPIALEFLKKETDFYTREHPARVHKAKSKTTTSTKKKTTRKATKKKVSRTTKKATNKVVSAPVAGLSSDAQELYKFLKEVRRKESKKRRVPAFQVFHDQTLREMAESRPENEEELLELYGVGEAKLKKYGRTFLKEIASFVEIL
jgi:ATP-dependent DNA helicase RecQ